MPPVDREVLLGGNIVRWNKITDVVNAVCHLSLPDRSRFGTGLLARCKIGAHKVVVVFTNNHVIENEEQAKRFIATFNFVDRRGILNSISLSPDIFYKSSPVDEFDYTMVGVKTAIIDELNNDFHITPVDLVVINPTEIQSLPWIYIPQHPGGMQKRLSQGRVCELKPFSILYDADTECGSSGSPVVYFDNGRCGVIALHNGNAVSSTGCRLNHGIFINTILSHANDEAVHPLPPLVRCGAESASFTEVEMTRIGQRVPERWAEIGLLTRKFKNYEISNIRLDQRFPDPCSKAIEMLNRYKRRCGTRESLVEALLQFNENELAENVAKQHFKTSYHEQNC